MIKKFAYELWLYFGYFDKKRFFVLILHKSNLERGKIKGKL